MRGLESINRLNDRAAAGAWIHRYKKLAKRAHDRGDHQRAVRYQKRVEEFRLFLSGQLERFPDRSRRQRDPLVTVPGRPTLAYPAEFVERVARADASNQRLVQALAQGRPIGWWFRQNDQASPDNGKQRQLTELRGYYRLILDGLVCVR